MIQVKSSVRCVNIEGKYNCFSITGKLLSHRKQGLKF